MCNLGGIGKIFGSLLGKAPKVAPIKPLEPVKPVEVAPVAEITDDAKKAKKLRSALYATEGGAQGAEIMSGGVSQRSTLLGN